MDDFKCIFLNEFNLCEMHDQIDYDEDYPIMFDACTGICLADDDDISEGMCDYFQE